MVRRREVLGGLIGLVLLWFGTVAVFFLEIVSDDYSAVFLYDGCINMGSVTVFMFCMLEVVVGAWFLGKYFLPILFGRELWDSFDPLKQQKLIGFIAQIVVRCACIVNLLNILAISVTSASPLFTLRDGFFSHWNAKLAYAKLIKDHVPTSCAEMNSNEVWAIRTWYFAKYHMAAVHIWELSFIPGLTIDGWLHHVFVVIVAAIGCQPMMFDKRLNPTIQPYVDAVGFSFIFGASLNAFVKACVVMYHWRSPNHLSQAMWMNLSIAGAWMILICFYITLPCVVAGLNVDKIGWGPVLTVVICPVIFLSCVEVRLVLVKRSIARNARRKAALALRDCQDLQVSIVADLPPAITPLNSTSQQVQGNHTTHSAAASPSLSTHSTHSRTLSFGVSRTFERDRVTSSVSFTISNPVSALVSFEQCLDEKPDLWKEAQC
jgi:hypothetical protein